MGNNVTCDATYDSAYVYAPKFNEQQNLSSCNYHKGGSLTQVCVKKGTHATALQVNNIYDCFNFALQHKEGDHNGHGVGAAQFIPNKKNDPECYKKQSSKCKGRCYTYPGEAFNVAADVVGNWCEKKN